MNRAYSAQQLRNENLAFAGTGGISENNRDSRFLPAFRDSQTGRVEIARLETGAPASMHLLCGLPDAWVVERDPEGHVVSICDSIIAGFVRDGDFYTREEAADLI